MAVTANIGTNSVFKYHATPGTAAATVYSAGTTLGGVQSGSFSVSTNMVDSTNNDDAGYESSVAGNQSAACSVDVVFDPSDTAQGNILAAVFSKAKFRIGVAPINSTTEDWYVFDCFVENADWNPGENDGLQIVSITFKPTGTITRSTVP